MFGRKHKQNAQEMAWLVRAAFELGYRAAKPDTKTDEWRPFWVDSKPRAVLKNMSYIKDGETWR